MNLRELITLYRARAQDKQEPYFCTDDLLKIYANEAQVEACRRGKLLRDSAIPMCVIAFAADQAVVPLDPKIITILRAHINDQPVQILSSSHMDAYHPNWQGDTVQDVPRILVQGLTTNAMHLWPRPKFGAELRLTVSRMPLAPMDQDEDEPEIRMEAHPALVEWMLYRAFTMQDTELYNEQRAVKCLQRFTDEFGTPQGLRNEEWVRDGGAGMGPYPIA